MRKKTILCLVLALCLLLNLPVFAAGQRVFDEAGLLGSGDVEELESLSESFQNSHGMDLVILTVADSHGKSTQSYMDDFYDEGGFGLGDSYDGVLLCIDMDNREINLSTCGKMIDIVSDGRYDEILDAMYAYVSEEDYATAFYQAIDLLNEYMVLGVEKGHDVYDADTGEILSPEEYGGYEEGYDPTFLILGFFGGALIGGITVLIIRANYRRKFKPAPYEFRKQANLSLTLNENRLRNSFVTTRKIPKNDSSSGGSGGSRSTVHHSSSGRIHGGGGGRKF